MSTRWQWQEGHGPGHLQRVTNSAAYNRAQRARQAYAEHQATCEVEGCPEGCPVAQELSKACRVAGGEGAG